MGQRESRRNPSTKIFLITFSHILLGFWWGGNTSFFVCISKKKEKEKKFDLIPFSYHLYHKLTKLNMSAYG